MAKICSVENGSIAEEMGVAPGDCLISIDGAPVHDVLDYRFRIHSESLRLQIEKPGGKLWDIDIEKESCEDLGIEFALPLMTEKLVCQNKCVFCFVDQQPPGLRRSLYFKDDDPRLSFLFGNYVTLTNIGLEEVERLAGYRLSPLKISVHTTNMALRQEMMGNKRAGNLFQALEIFKTAGIEMHFQVVLCKGLNDGKELDQTIEYLLDLSCSGRPHGEVGNSLAVVPAGLTKHRDGLYPLDCFSPSDSMEVITQVEAWQKKARAKAGTRFVFLADEWYIMARMDLPFYVQYEIFPQLDNGVGSFRLFERKFMQGAKQYTRTKHSRLTRKHTSKTQGSVHNEIGIVTGLAAGDLMSSLAIFFQKSFPETQITVYPIKNDFFGEGVTVSGLLTGDDIIRGLRGKVLPEVLFLPGNAFRHGEDVMLDGTTLEGLADALNTSVRVGSTDGLEFYKELAEV